MLSSELVSCMSQVVTTLFCGFFVHVHVFICFVFCCAINLIDHMFCLFKEYANIFSQAGNNPGEKTLEDKFYEREVSWNNSLQMYIIIIIIILYNNYYYKNNYNYVLKRTLFFY